MIRAVEDQLEERGILLSDAQGSEDSGEEVSDGRQAGGRPCLLQRLLNTCHPRNRKSDANTLWEIALYCLLWSSMMFCAVFALAYGMNITNPWVIVRRDIPHWEILLESNPIGSIQPPVTPYFLESRLELFVFKNDQFILLGLFLSFAVACCTPFPVLLLASGAALIEACNRTVLWTAAYVVILMAMMYHYPPNECVQPATSNFDECASIRDAGSTFYLMLKGFDRDKAETDSSYAALYWREWEATLQAGEATYATMYYYPIFFLRRVHCCIDFACGVDNVWLPRICSAR